MGFERLKKMLSEDDEKRCEEKKMMDMLMENGKIHEKLNFIMVKNARIEEHVSNIIKITEDHEIRIREVEGNYNKTVGGAAVISFLAVVISVTKALGLW